MQKKGRKLISLGLIAASASCLYLQCQAAPHKKPAYQKLLPKLDTAPAAAGPAKRLKGQIGQNITLEPRDFGNPWGYLPFGNSKLPQVVSRVLLMSPAYSSGLRPKDKILSAHFDGSKAELIVERDKKQYSCLISLDSSASEKPNLSPTAKILAEHSIVLLIDSSASMNTRDCPGGVSRWDWCRNQASDLCKEGQGLFDDKLCITTFNSQYVTHDKCKLEDLKRVFQDSIPEGETNMTPAIAEAESLVDSQLYSGKPAVIAVVTDGRPTDSQALKNKIKQIANQLRDPALLTIAFIEIGTPEHYLKELDDDMVKLGAKADIVVVFPFSAVNGQGLPKTLAAAVTERAEAIKAAENKAASLRGSSTFQQTRTAGGEVITKPQAPAKPQATAEQLEQQRMEKEKKQAEESKIRRAAANTSYDFSRPQPHAPVTAPVTRPAGQSGQYSQASPLEVDEQESVRRKESNRTYGNRRAGQ